MKSYTIKKLYKLHAWVGVITGILLFIIAFSGAVAVFARPELKIWANNDIRGEVPINPAAYQQLIDTYAKQVGDEYLEEIHVQFPGARSTEYARVIFEGHFEQPDGKEHHQGIVYQFHPTTLEEVSKTDMDTFFANPPLDMASFLAHFHADLHLGRPVGLILTGLLGLTLMVSIATGLIVHRKILAQLFTFRPTKSFSLMLNDGHKAMSVWGVMFHSVIAFTGAFLGLATVVMIPAAAWVSFNGDQEKLIETFTTMKPPVMSQIEGPSKLADIMETSRLQFPELTMTHMSIFGYGDKNNLVYMNGLGDSEMGSKSMLYKGEDGSFVKAEATFGRLEGITGKLLDVLFPLHFGNFGGILVKCLWAILGLSTALLPISGMMLWIERGLQAKNPSFSPATYHGLQRLLVGSCMGIVLATAFLFPSQLALNYWMAGADHTSAIFWLFFGSWGAALLFSLATKPVISFQVTAWITAGLLIVTMPLDALLNNSHLFNLHETGHLVSNLVDLTLFMLGLLIVWSVNKLDQRQATTTDIPHDSLAAME